MKTRSGFVSNSSSSSFIVTCDKEKLTDGSLHVKIDIDLTELFDVVIKNEADLKNNFEKLERYELSLERYEEIKNELRRGRVVCLGRHSNEDDRFEAPLNSTTFVQELLEQHADIDVLSFGRLD